MNFNVHFVNKRIAELSVDEKESGLLNAKEAKELAVALIQAASELLELSDE